MNRRQWLKNLAAAGAGSLLCRSLARSFAAGIPPAYLPHYVDVAKEAGLRAKTVLAGHESKDFLLSTTGGGIALFDYDNDGWLDIFVVAAGGLRTSLKAKSLPTTFIATIATGRLAT